MNQKKSLKDYTFSNKKKQKSTINKGNVKDIAIIGMAGRLPNAENIHEYWGNIVNKKSEPGKMSDERIDDIVNYSKYIQKNSFEFLNGSFLKEIDKFDYLYFGISPKEASLMSPLHRIFLETVWHAIEDSGYGGDRLKSSNTGVFVGYISDLNGYEYKNMINEVEDSSIFEMATMGNLSSIIPSRISYYLDFKGPSLMVDTACSSSMVAFHLACRSIREGECENAIIGGIKLYINPIDNGFRTGIESESGVTKTFDDGAMGTGIGEGSIALVIKPLVKAINDNDNVYAIIKGSSINQDGLSASISAPNGKAQSELLIKAWEDANVNPRTISYIEAHGTGTPLGDPIEIESLNNAFKHYTSDKQFCSVSSVKTNVGHLYDIAGLAGIVKAALSLKNEMIPPIANFSIPNKHIDFIDSALYISDESVPWKIEKDAPRRCGVSSFGFGGTNCHVVLEEPPEYSKRKQRDGFKYNVFAISAKSKKSLYELVKLYIDIEHDDLIDLTYTVLTGRGHYDYRLALVIDSIQELKDLLKLHYNDIEHVKSEHAFYGFNNSSPSFVKKEKNTEIKKDIIGLNSRVNELLLYYQEKPSKKILIDICQLYIRGAVVKWDLLYLDKNPKKVSLPVYAFEKTRAWIDIPKNEEMNNLLDKHFFTINWTKKDITSSKRDVQHQIKNILLFHDEEVNPDQNINLLKRRFNCIEVTIETTDKKGSDNQYIISNSETGMKRLFDSIDINTISHIIFMPGLLNDTKARFSDLKRAIQNRYYPLVFLSKYLMNASLTNKIKLIALADNGVKVIETDVINKPENASIFSFCRMVEKETDKIECKCIDIEKGFNTETLIMELTSSDDQKLIAYRNDERFIQELSTLDIETLPENKVSLKKNGAYIITGGAGDLGLAVAKRLSEKERINLIFINRSQYPAHDTWQEIIEKPEHPLYQKIKNMSEIERGGSNIELYSVDISKQKTLRNTINDIRKKYKSINGIIHCAGNSDEVFIKNINKSNIRKVMAPKVFGTWLLWNETKDDSLDFFILFSSISSIIGSPSQSIYASANAFLDSFTHFINQTEKHALSINWTAWKEIGMAHRKQVDFDTIFKNINPKDALDDFEVLLSKKIPQAIIAELNKKSTFLNKLLMSPIALSDKLKKGVRQLIADADKQLDGSTEKNSQASFAKYVTLSDSEIEGRIYKLTKKVLGYENIDMEASFIDLGADSIILSNLFNLLNKEFPGKLTIAKMFNYPTIKSLAEYLRAEYDTVKPDLNVGTSSFDANEPIAIIGMSGRFPDADSINQFYQNIRKGVCSIKDFPESRKVDVDAYVSVKFGSNKKIQYQKAAYLDDVKSFDYNYFKISPKEASLMDPNQRLFLQTSMEAIEDAGYGGDVLKGSKTGVFVGFSNNASINYINMVEDLDPSFLSVALPGNITSLIPSRIAYLLNLKGPSMIVDTACSSSLVAVHIACESLRKNECEMALAGGIKLKLFPVETDIRIGIESNDGFTKPFDDSSDGTGFGEGAGVILLKPLSKAIESGDPIHAVIKGSGINQDGKSASITAPNGSSQKELIMNTWRTANVEPESISYVEAHGTGTKLGDPIEIEALQESFQHYTDEKEFCAISGIKSNIGHLLEAAGIAGLIKAVCSLKSKELLPSLHFTTPNKRITFSDSPVFVNTELKPWVSNKYPRRCGISSFGFSGTNCHVVLEEFLPDDKTAETESPHPLIFTVSAKNDRVLKDFVNRYINFFENYSDGMDIADICYTSNIGRSHSESRLAILITSKQQLLNALRMAQVSDLHELNIEDGLKYGYHKVSMENHIQNEEYFITEETRNKLTMQSERVIDSILNDASDTENYTLLINLYCRGALVDWGRIHTEEKRSRLHLPIYPFQRLESWIKPNGNVFKSVDQTVSIHPLVEKCGIKSMNEDIYVTQFSVKKHFVVSDHKVLGEYVIPGATYPEIAKQIGSLYYKNCGIRIKNMVFTSPVFIAHDETKEIQFIVNKESDHLQFNAVSQSKSKDRWFSHVTCEIYRLNDNGPERYDISSLKEQCSKEIIDNIDVNELVKGFFEYGPRWQNYKSVRIGENTALAEIALPDRYLSDLETYDLHPGLIDISLGARAFFLGKRYIPLAYGSFNVYAPIPKRFYSYITQIENTEQTDQIIKYDISLIDEDGNCLLDVKEFSIKKADKFQNIEYTKLYSKMNWVSKELDVNDKKETNGITLFFNNQSDTSSKIATVLHENSDDFYEVSLGDELIIDDVNRIHFDGSEEDYQNIISVIQSGDKRIKRIVHCLTVEEPCDIGDVDELKSQLKKGIYSLFYLSKSLINQQIDYDIDLVVISDYANNVIHDEVSIKPLHASLFGLSEVVKKESPHLNCRWLDIDGNTDVETILAEIEYSGKEVDIALRGNERYVKELSEVNLLEVSQNPAKLKENGVYVITGGTGAIGLEIATYLSDEHSCTIALISRSVLPNESEWDTILSKDRDDLKAVRVIKKIKEIKASGSDVVHYSADVTDYDQMLRVFDDLREKKGTIDGVFHAAGIAGDGFIFKKSYQDFNAVIKPKILGTWILDKLTKHDELDFFVLFSSISTVLTPPGQSDYVSANAYLDSFAAFRRKNGRTATTINWTLWKEIGMGVEMGTDMKIVPNALTTAAAMSAFDTVLSKDLTWIAIGGQVNQNDLLKKLLEQTANDQDLNEESIELIGKPDGDYTETEFRVGQIWGNVLGHTKVSIYDNFYDLGGDSILATRLVNGYNSKYNQKINIVEVFNYLTIEKFAAYVDKSSLSQETGTGITKTDLRGHYPVSSAQKRVFIQEQFEGINTSYNIPIIYVMSRELDRTKLEDSLRKIVDRHEVLRTRFTIMDDEIVQIVENKVTVQIEYSELQSNDVHSEVIELIQPFQLDSAPLLRVKYLKTPDNKFVLFIDQHHIISDGMSVNLFMRELISFYVGIELPELKIQYKDYAVWQNKQLSGGTLNEQENYWKTVLQEPIPVLDIPLDFPRPNKRTFNGDNIRFEIPREYVDRLEEIGKNENVTLNTIFLTLYSLLLNKYSGNDDLIIGSIVSGRTVSEIDNLLGMFNNFIPIRLKTEASDTFSDLLRRSNRIIQNAYENQDYPYDKMLETLKIKTDSSRNPLFDTMLLFHNEFGSEFFSMASEFDVLEQNLLNENNSKLDIRVDVLATETGSLLCKVEYNSDLFLKERIERIEGHLTSIIKRFIDDINTKISDVEIITDNEKKEILYDFNNTTRPYDDSMSILKLFEDWSEKDPDKVALICNGETMTYMQLNRRANALAKSLLQKNVTADTIVAIMIERSFDMMVGIYAILKAGAAYLPISPDDPNERKQYILDDSGAGIILTSRKYALGELDGLIEILYLEDEDLYQPDDSNPEIPFTSNNLAYVIYTSGSTGQPKGAMIEHASVVNRLQWMQRRYPLHDMDVILQKTPYTFDVSVWELFWWSMHGASMCLLTPGGEKDVKTIIDTIDENKITIMHFVPSMLKVFLDYIEIDTAEYKNKLATLRHVFASGEALMVNHVNAFNKLIGVVNNVELHNLYGPTEATVDVSYFDCSLDRTPSIVPIGKPVDNTKLYILDEQFQILPIGIPGELYISGDQVARGYLNRDQLSAERFINDPFFPENRMYKTGDLTRWLPDGNIEYLGRLDLQVKIRGFRIELGEIEKTLAAYPGITNAAVIDKKDTAGDNFLCGFYTATQSIDTVDCKKFLGNSLPGYMVPSFLVKLDTMPLSANGKVDRKTLQKEEIIKKTVVTEMRNIQDFDQTGTNEIEKKLIQIWKDVLGIKHIGIYDNFFDFGGHSLKAASLISRIHRELHIQINMKDVFKLMTIKDIADYIIDKETCEYAGIKPAPPKDYYPLSSAQKRVYILSQFESIDTSYNLPVVIMTDGGIDKIRVEKTLQTLFEKHDSLKTYFEVIDGVPVQKTDKDLQFTIQYADLSDTPDFNAVDIDNLVSDFVQPFDLSKAPLFRFKMVKLDQDKNLLMFDIHHIVADGMSIVLLINDFVELYETNSTEPLHIQYTDYAVWQNNYLKSDAISSQKEYWMKMFGDELPLLNLQTDFKRPNIMSFEGETFHTVVPKELQQEIKDVFLQDSTTMYVVLLSAYYALLYAYTGQEDLIVGSPTVGRLHVETEKIIGMFVNTLALRSRPTGKKRFIDFVEEVKEIVLKAHENQEYQFEQMVTDLNITHDYSRNPLFDTMFILQNIELPETRIGSISFKPHEIKNKISKFDLSLEAIERSNGLLLNFEYSTKLFKRETIQRMANHYISILKGICSSPVVKLMDIEFMASEEKAQLLHDFNDTALEYDTDCTIHSLFEKQAEMNPDAIAVKYKDISISYCELNEKSNRLAGFLRENGISSNDVVGILTDRTPNMIVIILGILKAGGGYLPLDPEYPTDRIEYVVKDSRMKILLTSGNITVSEKLSAFVTVVNCNDIDLKQYNGMNVENTNSSSDIIYVIYTSGSTGKPKGVMIKHRSAINLVMGVTGEIEFRVGKKILCLTSITFDIFFLETLLSMTQGLTVVIADETDQMELSNISNIVQKEGINMIQATPSRLQLLLETDHRIFSCESLTEIMAGGESFPDKLLYDLKQISSAKMFNMYAPSESTVYSTIKEMSLENELTIGKPISNTRIFILDPNGSLLPIGIPGEICIGGEGLALGYLNNEKMTKEKFVPNPHDSDRMMYKTGDLGYWLPNGEIKFIGRRDFQVKIRGYRIELEEIEHILLKIESIIEAVVIARVDSRGTKFMCAYYVASEEISINELRSNVASKVPNYMVPSFFVRIDTMPLTISGKINRKALPEVTQNLETNYVTHGNELENQLVTIWKDVLETDIVGITNDFFELGGHSIAIMRVLNEITKAFNVKVSFNDFIERRTIREIALLIEQSEKIDDDLLKRYPKIEPDIKNLHVPFPLTEIQMAYLLGRGENIEMGNVSAHYYIEIESKMDIHKFNNSLNKVIARHPMLRAIILPTGEQQILSDAKEYHIEIVNMIDASPEERDRHILHDRQRLSQQVIDVGTWPLFEIKAYKISGDTHYLLISFDLLIADGTSIQIVGKELMQFYNNPETQLEELDFTFRDYLFAYKELKKGPLYKNDKQYWLNKLDDFPAYPDLPMSTNPIEVKNPTFSRQSCLIKTMDWLKIKKLCQNNNVTPSALLLTLYAEILAYWSNQPNMALNLTLFNRYPFHENVNNIVGDFTTVILIDIDLQLDNNFIDKIKRVQKTIMEALEHRHFDGVEMVRLIAEKNNVVGKPVMPIVFTSMLFGDNLNSWSVIGDVKMGTTQTPQVFLDFQAVEIPEGLSINWDYVSDIYDSDMIESMFEQYFDILMNIIP